MRLRDLDLNLLVSLDALLAERHVTRAAHRLGLSQPALSAQLVRLRRAFGDPLLVPTPQGMVPTPRGEELKGPLAALLAEVEGFLQEGAEFDPATSRATFQVAMPDAFHLALGAPLAARLRSAAPGTRLALRRVPVPDLAPHLGDGRLDLALVTPWAFHPHWRTRVLLHERFACVLRRGHPMSARPLNLDSFCAMDHLMVSTSGGGFTGVVDQALERVGRARRVMVSVEDFLVALAILERTDLVATLPAGLAGLVGPNLRVVPSPLDLDGFALHLAWHPRLHADPAQRWLREQVVALARVAHEPIASQAPFEPIAATSRANMEQGAP